MNNKLNIYTGIMLLALSLLSGCSSAPKQEFQKPKYPVISEVDAFKYEKSLLAEYEKLKANIIKPKILEEWIQPSNKKELCKIYTSNRPTSNEDYSIYWDGGCKDGYASGLGREFERGTFLDINYLAAYQGDKEKPKYFLTEYNMDGIFLKNLQEDYQIESEVINNNSIFNIITTSKYFNPVSGIELSVMRNLADDRTIYTKKYPNFTYLIFENVNEKIKRKFTIFDPDLNHIGYLIQEYRNGRTVHAEMTGEKNFVKYKVKLPESYTKKMLSIYSEIKDMEERSVEAEQAVNRVVQRYKNRICNDTVSVDFIGNNEYKKICTNSDHNITLRANIKQMQVEKIENTHRKMLTDTSISQANSAARAAMSAARAARAAEDASFNQSMQNMNQNTQMQSLNHNLFMMRMGL